MAARLLATTVMAIALALGVAGCAGDDARLPEPGPGVSEDDLLAARAGGASEEQLAILAKAPVPSFEDYEAATMRTLSCMRDAGIEPSDVRTRELNGITHIDYGIPVSSAGRSDGETSGIVDACYVEHSSWVDRAWQRQPAALEAQEQRFENARPLLIECLRENGIDVDEDLSTMEIFGVASDLLMETQEVDEATAVDCVAPSGILDLG